VKVTIACVLLCLTPLACGDDDTGGEGDYIDAPTDTGDPTTDDEYPKEFIDWTRLDVEDYNRDVLTGCYDGVRFAVVPDADGEGAVAMLGGIEANCPGSANG
jgi:hypothetical protein